MPLQARRLSSAMEVYMHPTYRLTAKIAVAALVAAGSPLALPAA